jgi:hypothetical protein
MKSFFLFLILLNLPSWAEPEIKGLYVDDFSSILGDESREDSLLQFAQEHQINYLCLYELHRVHSDLNLGDSVSAQPLADFIGKARGQYGILQVGASVENASFMMSTILPFNAYRTDSLQQFNVLNLEFEFWNSAVDSGGYYCETYLRDQELECSTSGAFEFYLQQLQTLDSMGEVQELISETYIGWPDSSQLVQIAQNTDRILVHSYRTDDSDLYAYQRSRLRFLSEGLSGVKVLPIFSAESEFMGPWLVSHSENLAFESFWNDFEGETEGWIEGINLQGYIWFAYRHLAANTPTPEVDVLEIREKCSKTASQYTRHQDEIHLVDENGSPKKIWLMQGQEISE